MAETAGAKQFNIQCQSCKTKPTTLSDYEFKFKTKKSEKNKVIGFCIACGKKVQGFISNAVALEHGFEEFVARVLGVAHQAVEVAQEASAQIESAEAAVAQESKD